jgi:toxin ParE1/3/4
MPFAVQFTTGARADLRSIHDYIATQDSPQNAAYVVREILRKVSSLQRSPDRGVFPPELLQVEIRAYRQVFFKPYRIVYRIGERTVYIVLIADGRRDLGSLLLRRLHEE